MYSTMSEQPPLRGHSIPVSCISLQFNDIFPISMSMDEVKIWRYKGETGPSQQVLGMKSRLPPPCGIDNCQVEVTSVNWKSQDDTAAASFALVSYRWHGIILIFSIRCWDHLPIGEWYINAVLCRFHHRLDPPQWCTFPMAQWQWQGPIVQPELVRCSSMCFAHEGFAVAGAAGESRVHVWDAECGDWLLFLDHGKDFKIHTLMTTYVQDDDHFLIVSGGKNQGKAYVLLWVTVPSTIMASVPLAYARHQIELSFMWNFWINISFIAVLAALLVYLNGSVM
ncbi:hypothetical protein BJV74DRAFT_794940 [Russula compacta]|nr:hypothetical protein BJV74DRAFT_794940 [Russula compacta]